MQYRQPDWQKELTARGVHPYSEEWDQRKKLELTKLVDGLIQLLDDPSYDAVDWEQGEYSDRRREVFTKKPTKTLSIDIEAIRDLGLEMGEYDCGVDNDYNPDNNEYNRLRRAVNARFRYALGESDD